MEKIQEKEEQRHFSVGGETSQRSPGCSVAYALKKEKEVGHASICQKMNLNGGKRQSEIL